MCSEAVVADRGTAGYFKFDPALFDTGDVTVEDIVEAGEIALAAIARKE